MYTEVHAGAPEAYKRRRYMPVFLLSGVGGFGPWQATQSLGVGL